MPPMLYIVSWIPFVHHFLTPSIHVAIYKLLAVAVSKHITPVIALGEYENSTFTSLFSIINIDPFCPNRYSVLYLYKKKHPHSFTFHCYFWEPYWAPTDIFSILQDHTILPLTISSHLSDQTEVVFSNPGLSLPLFHNYFQYNTSSNSILLFPFPNTFHLYILWIQLWLRRNQLPIYI